MYYQRLSRLLFPLAAFLVAPVFAQEDPELTALMAMLENETEIATQSKMNADYVPGMVTVLHGENLKQLGLTTVAEALNQVAAFYVTETNDGDKRVIVRGVGATLTSSHLKYMLDGIPLNRTTDGSADWLLRLPINQIDRLEIIRGPGSSVHGEYAFSGVVNVISRKSKALAIKGGSFDAGQMDTHISHDFDNGVSLQLNVAGWTQGNSGLKTNQDNFAASGAGYSPGDVYNYEQGLVLQAGIDWQGYLLQLQHASTERGPAYGNTAALPMDYDPRRENITNISLSKPFQLSDDVRIRMEWIEQYTQLDEASFLPIPPGVNPPGGIPPYTEDRFVQSGNEDSSSRVNVSLNWSGIDNHKVYADIGYAQHRVDDAFIAEFTPGSPKNYGTATQTNVLAGSNRTMTSLTLQDQWQLNDQIEMTFGGRYDHYSDWGSHLSPRLAGVWRLADHHILKAQYAEAFRPPTLSEAYPGPDSIAANNTGVELTEEILRSSEASYIYRESGHVVRATLFHTHIKDLIEYFIQPGQPPVWRNLGDIDTYGLELEWEQRLDQAWEWQANLAYVDAKDHLDTDEKLLGSVNWLSTVSLKWNDSDTTYHALSWRYVGEQEGWEIRTRLLPEDRFDSRNSLDYSFGIKQAFNIDGLVLSTGIKNLTDETHNIIPSLSQYPEGLPQGQRSAWLQLEYDW